MRCAYIVSPWAIDEQPILDEAGNPTGEVQRIQTPEICLMETYSPTGGVRGVPMEDMTGQYVHLDIPSPDPNLVLVRVCETGSMTDPHKHDGLIDEIDADPRFLVLDVWEEEKEEAYA